MIVFGGTNLVRFCCATKDYGLLNFMNLTNIGVRINELFPPPQFFEFSGNPDDSQTFDNCYAQYMLEDKNAFNALMRIMMGEYVCGDVFILFDDCSPLTCNLVESMSKFIKFRYGSNVCIVHEEIDMEYLGEDIDETTQENRITFMNDKEKYTLLNANPDTLVKETFKQEAISGVCI